MSNSPKKKWPESVQDLEEKWRNYDFTNVIGLLLLMQQIQSQERPKDPRVIMIAEDGTPYY